MGAHGRTIRLAALAVAVLVLVLVPRVFDLSADPADYWPFGTAWGDEGPWNHASAFAAQTGRWPDLPPPFHAMVPVYALLQRASFGWWGPGLAQARLLSVVCGLLTAGLLARGFRPLGVGWAAAAAALYGSDFWAIAVDRVATPEALCVALLTAGGCLLCLPERLGAAAGAGAVVLALMAALAKPPAAFGLPAVAAFVILERRRGAPLVRGEARARPWLLALLGVVGAGLLLGGGVVARWFSEGVMAQLRHATTVDGGWGAFVVERLAALLRIPLFYPFVVHHSIPVLGAGLLLLFPGSWLEKGGLRRRLLLFAVLWIGAWWVLTPFTNLRALRYAFLPVPVTILGVLGFEHWVEALRRGDAGLRRLACAVFAGWLLALWSQWLSDVAGLRARIGYPLLLLAALATAVAWFRMRPGRAPDGPSERRLAGLLACAVLAQLTVFACWTRERTHLIFSAQKVVASLPLGSQVVCGQEAPSLLLANPLNGRPLYYHWNPDCQYEGHRAELVLVPRSLECARAARYSFFVVHHERLLRLPELGRVTVPQWDGPRKLACELSFSSLGDVGKSP